MTSRIDQQHLYALPVCRLYTMCIGLKTNITLISTKVLGKSEIYLKKISLNRCDLLRCRNDTCGNADIIRLKIGPKLKVKLSF